MTPSAASGVTREVVHDAYKMGAVTRCCRRTMFELPRTDRVTLDLLLVTCTGRRS